jgi:diacylglycerol kinase (ATP)
MLARGRGRWQVPGGRILNRDSGESQSMSSKVNRGPRQIWRAFIWSLKGLREGWRVEASFRLEAILFAILFPIGLWWGHGAIEKALLAGSLLPVLAAEMLNSGLEAIVDKLWPGRDPVAGRAKDMGSAAVFLSMLNMLAIWIVILSARLG